MLEIDVKRRDPNFVFRVNSKIIKVYLREERDSLEREIAGIEFYSKQGINTPKILFYDKEEGVVIMEDSIMSTYYKSFVDGFVIRDYKSLEWALKIPLEFKIASNRLIIPKYLRTLHPFLSKRLKYRTPSHNDFSFHNICVDYKGRTIIVDFEKFSLESHVIIDFSRCLFSFLKCYTGLKLFFKDGDRISFLRRVANILLDCYQDILNVEGDVVDEVCKRLLELYLRRSQEHLKGSRILKDISEIIKKIPLRSIGGLIEEISESLS